MQGKRGGGQGEERGVGIDEHHAGQIKEARRGRDGGISAESGQAQSLEASLIWDILSIK